MTMLSNKPEGYITLKEASELFGYSPDYIGQLIRKGKIDGKQVYANVAWMTTKDSLEEYLSRERNSSAPEPLTIKAKLRRTLLSDQTTIGLNWFLRALIPLLLLALLCVFYFLSIAIDHTLTSRAQARLEQKELHATRANTFVESAQHISYEK